MKTNDFIVKRTKPAQTIVESAAPVAATELQFPQVDYGRRFNELNGVNESQGTARKYQTSKPEINFTAADINELSAIKDLPTLRARALQLISTSSAHPMKPEKVEWFRNAMENMNSPMRIIKLMYDLLLSGEGNKVLGSKNSMAPNSYRSRFGESNMSEDEELDGMALGELRAIVQDAKKIYQCVKNGTPLEAWMYKKITNSNESLTAVAQQIDNPGIRSPEGVAEGHADQQRKIFKKNGKPVGEVGIDPEASPGNGNWYVKHYASGYDVVGFDSYKEAVEELKHCMKQGVAEGSEKQLLKQVKQYCRDAWMSNGKLWIEGDPVQARWVSEMLNVKPIPGSVSGQYAFDIKQGVAEGKSRDGE